MPVSQWARAAGPVLEGPPGGQEAWAAVAVICAATLTGAWLARRPSRRITARLAVASAMMLVTATVEFLADAYTQALETRVPLWWPGLAAAFGFLVVTYFTRGACGHAHGLGDGRLGGLHAPGRHRRVRRIAEVALFGGVGTAAALTLHRALEGATLALTASAVVVAALAVHSASEGLALAALLNIARRRLSPWLALSCAGPIAGVLSAAFRPLPGWLVPILLSMMMGVLLRTAIVGLRLAASGQHGGRLTRRQVAAATTAALAMGVLLVSAHALGGDRQAPPATARHSPVIPSS